MLMLRNSVFRLRNVEIRAVLSSNEVDLLVLRNRVLRLRKVHICVVLHWNVVVQLIFTNSVFKLQKGSDMDFVELQEWLFADSQECHFRLRSVQIEAEPSCKRVY